MPYQGISADRSATAYGEAVSAENQLEIEGRLLTLVRPHARTESPLRAWSAADVRAIDRARDRLGTRVLIVNDQFGALTVGLAASNPTVWVDSALSRAAIQDNLDRNGLDQLSKDRLVAGSERPEGPFDSVVMGLPKSRALLESQLRAIREVISGTGNIIVGVMARHMQRSHLELFEEWIGPVDVSRSEQKSRSIEVTVDPNVVPDNEPAPVSYTLDDGTVVAVAAGVFSSDHLDIGTRVLLEHLDQAEVFAAGAQVLDLGCGSGVIAASLGRRHPGLELTMCDVSDTAIAAARSTWSMNNLEGSPEFVVADGIGWAADGQFDVIVSNPPFHQGHALDTDLTERLMTESAAALKPTGQLLVVGQRDIHLHTRLRRTFDSVETLSGHRSHVVLRATGPNKTPTVL